MIWCMYKSTTIVLRCMPVHELLKRLLLLFKMLHRRSCSFEMLGSCYLKTYTKAETLRPVSNDELELLSLRSKLPVAAITDICSHHEQVLVVKYSSLQKKCCNAYLVKFMRPTGNKQTHMYVFPEREDKCWIKEEDILCTIEPPQLKNARGQYLISHTKAKKAWDTKKGQHSYTEAKI